MRGEREYCPHCDYALMGLPRSVMQCPECGGSLTMQAYALAEARRLRGSMLARLVLWASPGVGIIGGIPIFLARRAFLDWLTFLFLVLWMGGATAVYFAGKGRARRSIGKAVGFGLVVGVLYFAAVSGIAVGIVFLLKVLLW